MRLICAEKKDWQAYCGDCATSSVYQDPRWLELIESVYPRIRIWRLVCKDDHGRLLWLLPLVEITPLGKMRPMLISLPFGNYGGFLLPHVRKQGVTNEMLMPLSEFFGNSRAFALEIREMDPPAHALKTEDHFLRFEVTFPESADQLWKKTLSGNARTSVRKADKMGVRTVFGHRHALQILQNIYERNASYHGTPIHHVSWYEKLAAMFPQETEIVLGAYEGKFIGALLLLHYQDTSVLHLSVSDPAYRTIPVTDKLIWSSFVRIMENRTSKRFDFGRTRPVPGKLFFKRKWGSAEHRLYYSYLVKTGERIPRILPENPKFGPAIQVWRHLPLSLKRMIGPFFRIRIPT